MTKSIPQQHDGRVVKGGKSQALIIYHVNSLLNARSAQCITPKNQHIAKIAKCITQRTCGRPELQTVSHKIRHSSFFTKRWKKPGKLQQKDQIKYSACSRPTPVFKTDVVLAMGPSHNIEGPNPFKKKKVSFSDFIFGGTHGHRGWVALRVSETQRK